MFLGLSDPDPLLFCMDPDPSNNQANKVKKNLISTIFFTSFRLFIYESMIPNVRVPSKKKFKKANFLLASCQHLTQKAGSGSVSQCMVQIRILPTSK